MILEDVSTVLYVDVVGRLGSVTAEMQPLVLFEEVCTYLHHKISLFWKYITLSINYYLLKLELSKFHPGLASNLRKGQIWSLG